MRKVHKKHKSHHKVEKEGRKEKRHRDNHNHNGTDKYVTDWNKYFRESENPSPIEITRRDVPGRPIDGSHRSLESRTYSEERIKSYNYKSHDRDYTSGRVDSKYDAHRAPAHTSSSRSILYRVPSDRIPPYHPKRDDKEYIDRNHYKPRRDDSFHEPLSKNCILKRLYEDDEYNQRRESTIRREGGDRNEKGKHVRPVSSSIVVRSMPSSEISKQHRRSDNSSDHSYKRRSCGVVDDMDENDQESKTKGNEITKYSDLGEEDLASLEHPPSVNQKPELPYYLPAIQGCRSVDEFQYLNHIGKGTYGVVNRAINKRTNEIVALKRLNMEKKREGFPIIFLREICTLLKANHPNCVRIQEVVVNSNMDKIYIVMDFVEHDLKHLMDGMKQPFLVGEVKTLLMQLLRGVHHLHDNWILHRDLKTSNILLSHGGILKIGDFGLAREYGSLVKPYTPNVVTLWYRSPELLLGVKEYSTAVDMWSVGCIFAELLKQKPLFQGKSEIMQIQLIFKELGTPTEKIWPGYNQLPIVKKTIFDKNPYTTLRKRFGATDISEKGFDLLNRFLTYCPDKRANAEEALQHEWFKETPKPVGTIHVSRLAN